MNRPEWAPSTDEELHGVELVSYWQDHAREWREYADSLELDRARLEGEIEAYKIAKMERPVCDGGRTMETVKKTHIEVQFI